MKYATLAILSTIPVLALSGRPEIEHEQREADRIVKHIYLSKEAHEYCQRNPDDNYTAQYLGMPVTVDCEVRNKWVELYLAGQIDQNGEVQKDKG